jgi:tRNA dimethylallyltransferase
MPPTLLIILGPTASGKTGLAIQLAQHFQTAILSADARQIFKEISIGTAKPTQKELHAAPHHLIDTHSITKDFSAGDFEEEALAILATCFQSNDLAIMAGGSGLYIRAVTEGLNDFPAIDPGIRESLNSEFKTQGIEALQNELAEKDPEYFELVDHKNPARLIRALEVIRGSGQPFSSFLNQNTTKRPFQMIKIGIETDRETLYNRIDQRVDEMLAAGLEQEVETIYQKYGEQVFTLNALQTVGYQELFAHLRGDFDREEAIRLIKRNSRRYAKRQMTWFKKERDVTWFAHDDLAAIIEHIGQTMQT